jgi:cbb3-type cytochrome oxidase cytochrome c subunit
MRRVSGAVVLGLLLIASTLGVGAQEPGLVHAGQQLFWAEGCYGCHTVRAAGTPIGPDLSRIGLRYSEDYLRRWVLDPEAQRPTAHMPRLELEPRQATALAAFLSSLR